MTSKRKYFFLSFFFFVQVVFWLFLIILSGRAIVAAYQALSWPVANGKVMLSQVELGCGEGDFYFPSIHYEYLIGRRTYVGERIAFGADGCGSLSAAQKIAARFPVHASVTIHFNPAKPEDAVLMAGEVLRDTWLRLLVGILLLIVYLRAGQLCIRDFRARR